MSAVNLAVALLKLETASPPLDLISGAFIRRRYSDSSFAVCPLTAVAVNEGLLSREFIYDAGDEVASNVYQALTTTFGVTKEVLHYVWQMWDSVPDITITQLADHIDTEDFGTA